MTIRKRMTRREVVRFGGAAGVAYVTLPGWVGGLSASSGSALAAPALATAKLTPELTEGPYWVNTMLRRFDVRANTRGVTTAPGAVQEGVKLRLTINVLDESDTARPLDGVAVDIWHANAHGLYSDESSQQSGGGTTNGDTSGENFLRGYQITGTDAGFKPAPAAGEVNFLTIWPGWYTGRAIHIHVRVRKLSSSGATIAGYTTQIFFSDTDNNRVLKGAPLQHPLAAGRPDNRRERHRAPSSRPLNQHRPRDRQHRPRVRGDVHHPARRLRNDHHREPRPTLRRRRARRRRARRREWSHDAVDTPIRSRSHGPVRQEKSADELLRASLARG